MTLRQLHSISKSYKRNASESVNLITIKRKMNDLCKEDEPDMRETLHSLKRKALKKIKAKKRHPNMEEIMRGIWIMNLNQMTLHLCGSEDRKAEDMADLVACDMLAKTALSDFGSFDFQDHHLHHPFRHQLPSDGNSSSELQVPCMGPNRDCKTTDITNPSEAFAVRDNQDIKSEAMITSSTNGSAAIKCDNYLSSGRGFVSTGTITSAVEIEQLLVLTINHEEALLSLMGPKSDYHHTKIRIDGKASRSLGDNLVIEAKEIRRDIRSEAREGHYKDELIDHPPERILSTRNTISPNSTERLRRAMNLA